MNKRIYEKGNKVKTFDEIQDDFIDPLTGLKLPGVPIKEVIPKYKLVGESFDLEGFNNAKQERWEPVEGNPGLYRCKVHNTFFRYNEENVELGFVQHEMELEPCWGCYNEFSIFRR